MWMVNSAMGKVSLIPINRHILWIASLTAILITAIPESILSQGLPFDPRFRDAPSNFERITPQPLKGRRVAMLVADGFNAVEGFYPLFRLREAGAEVVVIGAEAGKDYSGRGRYVVRSQLAVSAAKARDFDAVFIPGGEAPKVLREDPQMLRFVREAAQNNLWIAAICHGPQLLAHAGLLKGKQLTAWSELQAEMTQAGAQWREGVVITDGRLITAQDPWTTDQFTFTLIDALSRAS
jgi:protease I